MSIEPNFLNPKESLHACFGNIWPGKHCTIIASDLGGAITLTN